MKLVSIKNMLKAGSIFENGRTRYHVTRIDYDLKEMWIRENLRKMGTLGEEFPYQWSSDNSLRTYDVAQLEPLRLEDLI